MADSISPLERQRNQDLRTSLILGLKEQLGNGLSPPIPPPETLGTPEVGLTQPSYPICASMEVGMSP